MTHFICTGSCKGQGNSPGECKAEECEMHGQPLQACDCEDGKHGSEE